MSSELLLSRRGAFRQVFGVGVAAGLASCLSAVPLALAPEERKRISPHETVSEDLNGKKLTITYGRPSLKGRKMLGGQDPYGKVWRLGADEATKLTVTSRTMTAGDFALEPGRYGLFAIPYADHWTMIVNKVADQWGAFTYDKAQDVGRFDLKVRKLSAPAEEFTITMGKQGSNIVDATFSWGEASVSTQFKFV
jgi:DUF2911 family protein